jgi:hypothetical protein
MTTTAALTSTSATTRNHQPCATAPVRLDRGPPVSFYLPLLVAHREGAPRVAEVDLSGGAEVELGCEPAVA